MKLTKKSLHLRRAGAALIISMMFVLIFSSLGLALFAMSGSNVQIASNQQKVSRAFASAESGMHVMRYWLNRVLIPASTPTADYFSTIVSQVQTDLAANTISNITLNNDGSITPVMLNSATGQTFEGKIQISSADPCVLEAFATGSYGGITRTIRVNYNIEPYEHPIFDYGMATKGPVSFPGNPTITGVNFNQEADIYIDNSQAAALALSIGGNTNFDGDVYLGAGDSYFDGSVQIAGDYDQTAIDNHVHLDAPPVEFPTPDTARFQQYATGQVIDASTDTSDNMTLTNALIQAGANPVFEGNIRIDGLLFVEAPNTIVINGNVAIQGMIVGDGDPNNPTSSMTFYGNFESGPLPNDSQFDDLRSEDGSCMLVPGFAVELDGNFSSLEGVMAVSGFHLSGNASALVKGTILNFSDSPTVVEGNATLNFDRSGATKIPAGFDTLRELSYDCESYAMIH